MNQAHKVIDQYLIKGEDDRLTVSDTPSRMIKNNSHESEYRSLDGFDTGNRINTITKASTIDDPDFHKKMLSPIGNVQYNYKNNRTPLTTNTPTNSNFPSKKSSPRASNNTSSNNIIDPTSQYNLNNNSSALNSNKNSSNNLVNLNNTSPPSHQLKQHSNSLYPPLPPSHHSPSMHLHYHHHSTPTPQSYHIPPSFSHSILLNSNSSPYPNYSSHPHLSHSYITSPTNQKPSNSSSILSRETLESVTKNFTGKYYRGSPHTPFSPTNLNPYYKISPYSNHNHPYSSHLSWSSNSGVTSPPCEFSNSSDSYSLPQFPDYSIPIDSQASSVVNEKIENYDDDFSDAESNFQLKKNYTSSKMPMPLIPPSLHIPVLNGGNHNINNINHNINNINHNINHNFNNINHNINHNFNNKINHNINQNVSSNRYINSKNSNSNNNIKIQEDDDDEIGEGDFGLNGDFDNLRIKEAEYVDQFSDEDDMKEFDAESDDDFDTPSVHSSSKTQQTRPSSFKSNSSGGSSPNKGGSSISNFSQINSLSGGTVRIVLVGDSKSGKTTIARTFKQTLTNLTNKYIHSEITLDSLNSIVNHFHSNPNSVNSHFEAAGMHTPSSSSKENRPPIEVYKGIEEPILDTNYIEKENTNCTLNSSNSSSENFSFNIPSFLLQPILDLQNETSTYNVPFFSDWKVEVEDTTSGNFKLNFDNNSMFWDRYKPLIFPNNIHSKSGEQSGSSKPPTPTSNGFCPCPSVIIFVLVVDLSKSYWFDKAKDWVNSIRTQLGSTVPILLLGNKGDTPNLILLNEKDRSSRNFYNLYEGNFSLQRNNHFNEISYIYQNQFKEESKLLKTLKAGPSAIYLGISSINNQGIINSIGGAILLALESFLNKMKNSTQNGHLSVNNNSPPDHNSGSSNSTYYLSSIGVIKIIDEVIKRLNSNNIKKEALTPNNLPPNNEDSQQYRWSASTAPTTEQSSPPNTLTQRFSQDLSYPHQLPSVQGIEPELNLKSSFLKNPQELGISVQTSNNVNKTSSQPPTNKTSSQSTANKTSTKAKGSLETVPVTNDINNACQCIIS